MNANNSNGSIILNPAMLDKNHMCINHSRDAQHDPLARGNTTNPGNNNDLVTKKTAPFTIHGYKSAKRDPHSEISCWFNESVRDMVYDKTIDNQNGNDMNDR